MLKFSVALFAVFFVILITNGFQSALIASVVIAYFIASVRLPFLIHQAIASKQFRLKLEDILGIVFVALCIPLAIWHWGWSRFLIFLALPFAIGGFVLMATLLQIKMGNKT